MKRIHLILILAFVLIAAVMQWKGVRFHKQEADLRRELAELQMPEAKQNDSPAEVASITPRTNSGTRPPAQNGDAERFVSGLKERIAGEENVSGLIKGYIEEHREFLATAPTKTLKEICELLPTTNLAYLDSWELRTFPIMVAQLDPAWVFGHYERVLPLQGRENAAKSILTIGGKDNLLPHQWTPGYALAFKNWLDDAQAAGRMEGLDLDVNRARIDIAMITGDPAEATRYFALLPTNWQDEDLANKIVKGAAGLDALMQVIRQADASAAPLVFREITLSMVRHSGFETARDILVRAKLPAANHDLAATIIAGTEIDADTPARAEWLLKTLQTDQADPITQFAKSWTEGDFKAASVWVNSLPQGRRRDAAVVGFAPAAARIDGASAVDWALTITDPAQRKTTLASVSQTWKKREPAAAASYLREKGIVTE